MGCCVFMPCPPGLLGDLTTVVERDQYLVRAGGAVAAQHVWLSGKSGVGNRTLLLPRAGDPIVRLTRLHLS
jgi:hypothetical protein